MTCRTDSCCQGRTDCPTPDECADTPFHPIRYALAYMSVWLRWQDHAAAKRAGHLATLTPPPKEPDGIVYAGDEPVTLAALLIAVLTIASLIGLVVYLARLFAGLPIYVA